MASKFVVFAACLAAARAGLVPVSAPLSYAAPLAKAIVADYHHQPQYAYGYGVQDALTGDNKHHEESRNGDIVKGSYSLQESDGTRRVVHYTADPINGFNAVVDKQPAALAVKSVAPVVAAPVAYAGYAAPTYAKFASPLTYAAPAYAKLAAPLSYNSYAAPATYASYAAPVSYASYSAPLTSYAAPLAAKIASPISYASYASPYAQAYTSAYHAW